MKFLTPFLFLFLMSCSLLKDEGTADYDRDGIVSDAEYDRFNKEQKEQAKEITENSVKPDPGFTWRSLNPF